MHLRFLFPNAKTRERKCAMKSASTFLFSCTVSRDMALLAGELADNFTNTSVEFLLSLSANMDLNHSVP